MGWIILYWISYEDQINWSSNYDLDYRKCEKVGSSGFSVFHWASCSNFGFALLLATLYPIWQIAKIMIVPKLLKRLCSTPSVLWKFLKLFLLMMNVHGKADFYLDGYDNKQNSWFWAAENHHELHQGTFHCYKVTACGKWGSLDLTFF